MIGQALGHFRILERIGAGGMGVVYRARDERLEREVALKVLPEGTLGDDVARWRFRKEALALSSLNHPNIEIIYDFDTQQGLDFLVMEYVRGRNLREHLGAGPMDPLQAAGLAEQCAMALAAAHQQGVIHLDIKPENIILTPSGQVKLLDFGVAVRLRPADSDAVTESLPPGARTGAGGTSAYMAPEALMQKKVDARADLFSLGVVSYECLTGRHPFLAPNLAATVARILHEEVPVPSRLNPRVPEDLERVVLRLLAKDAERRHASAAQVAAELREIRRRLESDAAPAAARPGVRRIRRGPMLLPALLGVALLAALTLVGRQAWRDRGGPVAPTAARIRGLAVLPFSASSDDPRARAFAQGLSEALAHRLNGLAGADEFELVSAREVDRVAPTDAAGAARELGARWVLTGGLERAGEEITLRLRLADFGSGGAALERVVRGRPEEPFALEDRLAEASLALLGGGGSGAGGSPPVERSTGVAGAYDFYLQGRGYLRNYGRTENLESAITVFQRALALDPDFALAHAGLGMAYWHKFDATREAAWVERATQACGRATALAGGAAEGRLCLGMVHLDTGRYEEAARELELAAALDPRDEEKLLWLARGYDALGRPADAEKTYRRAIALRPHYWAGYNVLGAHFFEQARYREAEEMFQQVVALAPDSSRGFLNLGTTYMLQGRYREAIPVLERSLSLHPTPLAHSNLGAAHFLLKRFDLAAAAYEKAIEIGEEEYYLWGNLGEAYARADARPERAAQAYRRAADLALAELRVNPRNAEVLADLAKYYAALGEEKQALEVITRCLALGDPGPEGRFAVAEAFNLLGRTVEALDWLEKSLAAGFSVSWARDTPTLENLRDTKRFRTIVQGGE
jgi:tetratricopeptide (TPR) repeat protein/TolB-like protein/predicted Ser/Thr protein kinase